MQDYFDFLIDMALDMKDFKWVEDLQRSKLEYISNKNKEKKKEKSVIALTLEIKNMDEINQMIDDLRQRLANLEIGFKQDED